MLIAIGAVIIILTIAAILKKIDPRIALFISGLLMCVIAGDPGSIVPAFSGQLISSSLVPMTTTCMGFSAVMEYTKCTDHLIHLLTRPLRRVKMLLVPGTVIVTWIINISLQSAAAVGAAVGALMVPLMMSFGINPAIAAAAVLMGTWGNSVNPGQAWVVQLSEIANISTTEVVGTYFIQSVVVLVITAAVLAATNIFFYKNKNGQLAATSTELAEDAEAEKFKINPFKAILPMLPIIMIMLGGVIHITTDVTTWMLVGSAIGIAISFKDYKKASGAFFKGMGTAFGDVIVLIGSAAVFTAGMSAIGITDALLELMRNAQSVAKIGAAYGPFALAAVTGSGNAATAAFNEAFTPYAAEFGYGVKELGAVALLSGQFGRTCSPVAGVTIILAGIAKADPMDVAKNSAVPMVLASLIFMLLFL